MRANAPGGVRGDAAIHVSVETSRLHLRKNPFGAVSVAEQFQRVRERPPALGAQRATEIASSVVGARIALLIDAPRGRDEWLAAVKKDWNALGNAPPSIRADREIVLAAIAQDKGALAMAAAELREDRAFLLDAINVRASVLRVVEDRFLDDRSFVLDALRAGSMAHYGLIERRPELFTDRASLLEMVGANYHVWELLERKGLPLAADPSFVLEAVKAQPWIANHFGPANRASERITEALIDAREWRMAGQMAPEVLLREPWLPRLQAALASGEASTFGFPNALAHHPKILPWAIAGDRRSFTSASIQNVIAADPSLAAACLALDPLLYRDLPKQLARTIDRTHPELTKRTKQVESQLRALDLELLTSRVSRFSTIEELIRNRTTSGANDPRPVALLVYPTTDWNKAFEHNELDELLKGYRVVYHEVGTEKAALRAFEQGTKDKKASLVVIGGHGTQTQTHLGGWSQLPNLPLFFERRFLDLGDEAQIQRAKIAERVAPGAHLILESCSTGKGRESAGNMANMFGRIFPHATIHAPTEPASCRIILDAEGLFADVDYGKPGIRYDVPPR